MNLYYICSFQGASIYKPFRDRIRSTGSHLLSRIVSNAVPSAGVGLTVVFGMETGVTPFRIAASIFRPRFGGFRPLHENSTVKHTPETLSCSALAWLLSSAVVSDSASLRAMRGTH